MLQDNERKIISHVRKKEDFWQHRSLKMHRTEKTLHTQRQIEKLLHSIRMIPIQSQSKLIAEIKSAKNISKKAVHSRVRFINKSSMVSKIYQLLMRAHHFLFSVFFSSIFFYRKLRNQWSIIRIHFRYTNQSTVQPST